MFTYSFAVLLPGSPEGFKIGTQKSQRGVLDIPFAYCNLLCFSGIFLGLCFAFHLVVCLGRSQGLGLLEAIGRAKGRLQLWHLFFKELKLLHTFQGCVKHFQKIRCSRPYHTTFLWMSIRFAMVFSAEDLENQWTQEPKQQVFTAHFGGSNIHGPFSKRFCGLSLSQQLACGQGPSGALQDERVQNDCGESWCAPWGETKMLASSKRL